MKGNYYFGNPQIFKMPKKFRTPSKQLTPSLVLPAKEGLGAFEQGTVTKALPYIAVGIAGLVAYNMIKN